MQCVIFEDVLVKGVERNVVVYLGDYIDWGMDSKGVIDYLMQDMILGVELVFFKGNYEEVLINFLFDVWYGCIWKNFGGFEMFLSYGVMLFVKVDDLDDFKGVCDQFVEKLLKEYLDFIKGFKLSEIFGDYMFVYVGVCFGIDLDKQCVEDLLWICGEFFWFKEDFGKIIVYGYIFQLKLEFCSNCINVDIGVYIMNELVVVVFEGEEYLFLKVGLLGVFKVEF